jgi:putative FmdB family regulatory protein
MPLYDARCTKCEHEFEESRRWDEGVSSCPVCHSVARTIWKRVPILDKAKDPYDLIECGTVPDPKPIKSFAKDHRKGGKNTV